MTTNVINQSPLLRGSREFPEEITQLTQEVSKSYLEIANAVNNRTIGIFPINRPAITGNTWFIKGSQKNQTLRQIYTFTGSTLAIPHNISLTQIPGFVQIFGTFTDGTNWYPLPYVDSTAINKQVSVKITPSNIQITAGAGAPAIVSGYVVLEWLLNV